MRAAKQALVYTIGLAPSMARALRADLAGVVVRRQRPLHGRGVRSAERPDLVLLDVSATDAGAEEAAARAAWGEHVVIVRLDAQRPYAEICWGAKQADLVEIGPGFLAPYLAPAASLGAA